ncbi:MAG: peptidylprolyl isomerase [Alloprevotella sp.]|nr:peptidylprolyl isomerase [Alloprevotella sp.]
MKDLQTRILSMLFVMIAFGWSMASAQQSDPIVMTINEHPVMWSEFYYSYAKNGDQNALIDQKTIEEYIPMYVDYRLKVEAAKEARLDTLKSFRDEFALYRDMQLTPYLVDSAYIDSVAYSVYLQTIEQFHGKELRRPAHIFIALSPNADADEQKRAKALIDSLYVELQNGADFGALATQFSTDEATVQSGGELPWIGHGMALQNFETELFRLQEGEISQPILTEVGYHIIKLLEIRSLDNYDEQKPFILDMLEKNNIRETSAEHRIKQLIENSNGRLDREAVIDSVLNAHLDNLPLRYLVEEYHDGLLMFEISQRNIWEPTLNDSVKLAKFYAANKQKYAWSEPRFKGFVFHYKHKADKKKIEKLLKKYGKTNWRKPLHNTFNHDSVTVSVTGPYLSKKGENAFIDQYAFQGPVAKARTRFPYNGVSGKVIKQPESYQDVKSDVVADLQEQLSQNWLTELRKKYPVFVDEKLIQSLYNKEIQK